MEQNLKKKILILSASAGNGHLHAAEALVKTAEEFQGLEVIHKDILDLSPSYFKLFYAGSYKMLSKKFHSLWRYIYYSTDESPRGSITNILRRMIEHAHTKKLYSFIKSAAPSHIICTHFMPAELLSARIARGKLNIPVWVQITDFDAHSFWIQPNMAGYFAPNEEVAYRLQASGIRKEIIRVTGIPIKPQFMQKPLKYESTVNLQLSPEKVTALLMAGGDGVIALDKLALRLMALDNNLQLVVICGKNQKLFNSIREISSRFPGRVAGMGFTTEIEKPMSICSFAITKAGGLTTSECLAMGLPMIIISPIPGQEERNASYITESGAGFSASGISSLEYKVKILLDKPELMELMSKNALKIARPYSAREVLKTVTSN